MTFSSGNSGSWPGSLAGPVTLPVGMVVFVSMVVSLVIVWLTLEVTLFALVSFCAFVTGSDTVGMIATVSKTATSSAVIFIISPKSVILY